MEMNEENWVDIIKYRITNILRKLCVSIIFITFCISTQYGQNRQYESRAFFGKTNDRLYWNEQMYYLSESPLDYFTDYKYIYPHFFIHVTCRVTYEACIDEKNYIAAWTIMNDSLYLCSTKWNCDTNHSEEIIQYYIYMLNPYKYDQYLLEKIYNTGRNGGLKDQRSVNYLFTKKRFKYFNRNNDNVLNSPIEELTGMKFRHSPSFPYSIMRIPVTSDGVIPATWFTGVLDIKSTHTDYFSSYKRLAIEEGKITSVQVIRVDNVSD